MEVYDYGSKDKFGGLALQLFEFAISVYYLAKAYYIYVEAKTLKKTNHLD
ncbi:hypothetical protein LNA01_02970 [Companilactobacillus nantensis]|nr:hypothetical protein LNA01_02970 [Companilactobacillus nantensis]